jgi:hypothetical protein
MNVTNSSDRIEKVGADDPRICVSYSWKDHKSSIDPATASEAAISKALDPRLGYTLLVRRFRLRLLLILADLSKIKRQVKQAKEKSIQDTHRNGSDQSSLLSHS